MSKLTAFDELRAHQIPEPQAHVQTMATFPQRGIMHSLQMGRVNGVRILGRHD